MWILAIQPVRRPASHATLDSLSILIGGFSATIGWWVRGRVERCATNQHKRLVKDAMEGLQECTSKIRTWIAAHSSEVAKVAEALRSQDTWDGAEVASAASIIVSTSDRVRVQLTEIELKLQMESTVIGRSISEHEPELLIIKSMELMRRGELAVKAASDQGGNATYLADCSGVTRITAVASSI